MDIGRSCSICSRVPKKSANQLTVAAQDPISKIPQYKVCGCRVRKAEAPPDYVDKLEPQQ
jgi:assimilatory nitrate reductase catalytic subunit